jgi:hypothetical protein
MMTTKRRKIGRKTDWSDLVMPPTMHSEFNLATERNTRRVPTWSALGNASVARMIMGFLPLSEVLWWLDVCKTWRNHVLDPMTQAYWIRRIRKTLIDNKYCSSSLLDVFTSSGFWITGSALQLAMGQPSMVPPNNTTLFKNQSPTHNSNDLVDYQKNIIIQTISSLAEHGMIS